MSNRRGHLGNGCDRIAADSLRRVLRSASSISLLSLMSRLTKYQHSTRPLQHQVTARLSRKTSDMLRRRAGFETCLPTVLPISRHDEIYDSDCASVVRIKNVKSDLFQLQTGVIHDAPVDIVKRALSVRARDEGKNRFHEQSEVLFSVSNASSALLCRRCP